MLLKYETITQTPQYHEIEIEDEEFIAIRYKDSSARTCYIAFIRRDTKEQYSIEIQADSIAFIKMNGSPEIHARKYFSERSAELISKQRFQEEIDKKRYMLFYIYSII